MGASEGYNRRMLKNAFAAAVRGEQQIEMFFDDVRDVRKTRNPNLGREN